MLAFNQEKTARLLHSDLTDAPAFVRGEVAAFERIYGRHHSRVNALARWLLSTDDTDDVIQDVFIRLWNKRTLYDGDAPFDKWLGRLAINVILAHRGRTRKMAAREDSGDYDLLHNIPLRTSADENIDTAIDLEAAVPELPDGAREVFVLFDVQGYSHEEIATMLRVNIGTSRSQLHRARTLLRKRLAARGGAK